MDYFQSSNPDSRAEPSPMAENGKDKKKKGIRVKKLSTDPQSVAARERRHRISNRFKILQSLVPGGSKMDTATMLDEAIHYVKYLKSQIWFHKNMVNFNMDDTSSNIFDDDDDVDLSINSTTVILPSSSSVASADQVPLTLPMYSQQQQPEFFGAVQPSPPSVPCYQLGEGTMYFDM